MNNQASSLFCPMTLGRWLLYGAVAVSVAVAAFFLFPGEQTKIRRHLEELATACSFDAGPPKAPALARMHAALRARLGDTIAVEIDDLREPSLSRDELTEGFIAYTQGLRALSLRVEGVTITLNQTATQAIAEGTLLTEQVEPSDIRRSERRPFSAIFTKKDGNWVIVRAKVGGG
jgi:hypothetical protein